MDQTDAVPTSAEETEPVVDVSSSEGVASSDDVEDAVVSNEVGANVPTVDELEDQMNDLQRAMDQLQSGDLDGAEATIEALELKVGALSSEADG